MAERVVSVQHVGDTLVVIRRIESNILLISCAANLALQGGEG